MKVYTIEQGSYSDYHIIGVFSTRENAERMIARMDSSYEKPWIEEREIDPGITELSQGLNLYMVRFRGDETAVESRGDINPEDCIWKDGACYFVWAENDQAAIKIAAEKYAQYKAEEKGLV